MTYALRPSYHVSKLRNRLKQLGASAQALDEI